MDIREHNVPLPSELTPSEIVFLFGDRFAPIVVESGMLARLKAEYRFGRQRLLMVILGLAFAGISLPFLVPNLAAISSGWTEVDWQGAAFMGVFALSGLSLIVFSTWDYVVDRRTATAAEFAPEGSTALLDRSRSANRNDLVIRTIAAAIVANHQAGAITLCDTEQGVLVTPTGRATLWPPSTVEARIVGESPATVRELVHEWLASDSVDPFRRALRMVQIGAVVHGYAQVDGASGLMLHDEKYSLRPEATAAYASLSPATAISVLDQCRDQLLTEIASAIQARTHIFTVTHYEGQIPKDSFEEPTPWKLEASMDRLDETNSTTRTNSPWGPFAAAVFLGLVLVARQWEGHPQIGAGVFAAITLVFVASAQWGRFRGKLGQRLLIGVFVGEFFSLLVAIAVEYWLVGGLLLLAAAAVARGVLRKNAEVKIQMRIQEIERTAQAGLPSITRNESMAAARPPQRAIPLIIIDPDTLLSAGVPVKPTSSMPLRLLLLRVFGSPAIDDLLALTMPWESFGVIVHLAGPGTAGEKLTDMLEVAIGRVDKAITGNDRELDEAFARITALRRGRDSIQCTAATWKKAVDRMLSDATAVLMDLSSMSREHQGCAYELGRLLDEVPLSRVTLLVNDDTDLDCLQEILDQAWTQIAAASPNRDATDRCWSAIRIGGRSAARPDENSYEWKRRSSHRLTSDRLMAFLLKSAATE